VLSCATFIHEVCGGSGASVYPVFAIELRWYIDYLRADGELLAVRRINDP